jgi:hypothetical protein
MSDILIVCAFAAWVLVGIPAISWFIYKKYGWRVLAIMWGFLFVQAFVRVFLL